MSDKYIDPMAAQIGVDVSLGIGQVRLSTAKKLEDMGYVPKIETDTKHILRGNAAGGEPTMIDLESSLRCAALMNDTTNIQYVAAYLKYIQNLWINKYPEIDGKSDILGTLYNIGEYGSNGVNSSPSANPFGQTVKDNYQKMQELLGIS